MGINLNQACEPKKCVGRSASTVLHELDQQRLRILRCTAQAMFSSPGGLRFRAGTRPWLDGISACLPAPARLNDRLRDASARLAAS